MLFSSCCLIFIRALETITAVNNIKVCRQEGSKTSLSPSLIIDYKVCEYYVITLILLWDYIVKLLSTFIVCFYLIQSCETVLREKI